jgi:acetylglutamate kinase
VILAEMALVGQVNREIVGLLNHLGVSAVGLSGKDANLIQARKLYARVREGEDEGEPLDIGFVGEITRVNSHIITVLESEGFIPVIAGTGVGEAGETYNINADTVAGAVAAALGAAKLILLSDIRGVLREKDDPTSLISSIRAGDVPGLREEGVFSAGMIPKIEACVTALEGGVRKAHIIDGRISHSLLHEVFTHDGIGTQLTKD